MFGCTGYARLSHLLWQRMGAPWRAHHWGETPADQPAIARRAGLSFGRTNAGLGALHGLYLPPHPLFRLRRRGRPGWIPMPTRDPIRTGRRGKCLRRTSDSAAHRCLAHRAHRPRRLGSSVLIGRISYDMLPSCHLQRCHHVRSDALSKQLKIVEAVNIRGRPVSPRRAGG